MSHRVVWLLVLAWPDVRPRRPSRRPAITAALEGDALRPASANGWVRSELYFGVGEETDRPTVPRPSRSARRRGAPSWTRK